MTLSDSAIFFLGLLLAAWVVGGIWAVSVGLSMRRKAEATLRQSRRLGKMLDEAPALPLLVRTDGRIEGPERLARWFGLETLPRFFSDLEQNDSGWSAEDIERLQKHITSAQKTARPFAANIRMQGSARSLDIKGHQADPQIAPLGAALLWVFDNSESQEQIASLQSGIARAETAFESLSALIEAAPMPMWHRDAEFNITLVNSAYVKAVDGTDAQQVVSEGIELVEAVKGLAPAAVAAQAQSEERMIERTVATTIDGKRQVLRVVDLPLGAAGVAGYAINVQELESLRGEFQQFRRAQRDMLDNMSAGVAQFDSEKALVFCNQPFQRIFALRPQWVNNAPEFDRILDRMREAGCIPEVRDFPEWKGQKRTWFNSAAANEENWLLPNGTHLRAIAQPTPDGGLLLIFEDRTEQIRLASSRDTLLRVRTAMFDSLFEALAVFAPDGRLNLWNRRFSQLWDMDEAVLAEHPRIDHLMKMLVPSLKNSAQISVLRDIIRAATLDRRRRSGSITLADGRCLEFAGIPLPDGNAMLTMLDASQSAGDLEKPDAEPDDGTRINIQTMLVVLAQERMQTVEDKDIDLDMQIDPRVGKWHGDDASLAKAVGNIIDHSLLTTHPGGRVLVHVEPKEDKTRLIISDNASGMDARTVSTILDSLSGPLEPQAGGLPFAKQLIETLGGTFDIISEPGEGTVVTLMLP